ncbi:dienelactone hydrolase [Novosphingobium sp.]|uniref:alpha/beta hydrolase family protein n=1 Tax=Novosphingobium sp. TaxID=1874826 RepID=UPI0033411677
MIATRHRPFRDLLRHGGVALLAALLAGPGLGIAHAEPATMAPSVPDIDAPELAAIGPAAAGMRTQIIAVHDVIDPLASLAAGHAVLATRVLHLRIWYPAKPTPGTAPVTYTASLTGEKGTADAAFTVPGIALANAAPAGEHYPVVVLSHGYNNDPVMLSWLGENLATKGYVVVAPEHRDPPIWDRTKTPAALLARPLDITATISAVRGGMLGTLVDADRLGLIGYSMGGYGVLAVAGARLDPHSPAVAALPADLVAAYAGSGAKAGSLVDAGVRAVVAISPAGGAPWSVFGADGAGLAGVHAPLLVIAGSADRTVGFEKGPVALFEGAVHSDRHMLVLVAAGHDIGTNPPPVEMHARLWDFDWFSDPVWRKDRINAIATHFITAFLDTRLKGDVARAAYLDVPAEASDHAEWKGDAPGYAAMSQGGANPTWKGFWRGHQDGLILWHKPAQP